MAKAEDRLKARAENRFKRQGRRGLRGRPVRWRHPDQIEREYVAELRRMMRDIIKHVNQNVASEISTLVKEAAETFETDGRQDARRSWARRIEQLISAAQVFGQRRASEIDPRVYGVKVSRYNKTQRNAVIRSVLGVDITVAEPWLSDMLLSWGNENRKLIKTIPQRMLDDLEGIVQRGMRQGTPTKNIRDQIRHRYRVTASRAQLIARDQIGKLNGQLTEQRQEQIGIKKFRWITMDDKDVRPEHEERHNKIYEWDNPPADGIPGFPINCRCYAEPVLDELLDELENQ